ncbi:type II toxin-antitoxin system YafQ family toxin [Bulleidia sp. zg-1006]|uniref:type II toxin-antitoxin system YafQ family toxin n=1 Tax=Bulleidia sp. zg-1006 TaxID=2806552 RepID=UPI002106DE98|nr:type II toxin-antitoxin system YafQ family toxin [Bulleidia sp. zg-1006]
MQSYFFKCIILTNKKTDLKRMKKRGYDLSLLTDILNLPATGKPLPEKNKDHTLTGNFKEYREYHIAPDWLLIYEIFDGELILYLTRTGTHSDLF